MREVKRAVKVGEPVTICGCAVYRGPGDPPPVAPIVGGYALTHNVDADFFSTWLEQNKDSDLVRNRLVFAHAKPDLATGQAKEQAEVRSGLEPLAVPASGEKVKDPRVAKSIGSVLTADVK